MSSKTQDRPAEHNGRGCAFCAIGDSSQLVAGTAAPLRVLGAIIGFVDGEDMRPTSLPTSWWWMKTASRFRRASQTVRELLHVVVAQSVPTSARLARIHGHALVGSTRVTGFFISGFEMEKGLAGIVTHEHDLWVPIFDNTQDIPALAQQVAARFDDRERPLRHGFLIRRHGLYTWGKDLAEARRHVETFEFLFEVVGRKTLR